MFLTFDTATTVGFGDAMPVTDAGKFAAGAFALVSVGATQSLLSSIGDCFLSRCQPLPRLTPAAAATPTAAAAYRAGPASATWAEPVMRRRHGPARRSRWARLWAD
mmetsp:Transcript_55719/g.147179  ORF Transcript_55719/g.147179 Transcript_55719/m.147179 type:complete len:106 (-) Transcript_55719:574-891(-)